jgi:hypothetical protein
MGQMNVLRTWRVLAAAGAGAVLLSGCGGRGDGGAGPPATAAAVTATPTATPATPGAAFQAALDRLLARTVVLRAARALAAARFNSTPEPGADRDVARKLVQAACADLAKAYSEFDVAVVAVDYPADANGDVDTLVTATRGLVGILDQYRTAFEGVDFTTINNQEVRSTAAWEKAVAKVADKLGVSTTAAPTPTATA